MLNCSFHCGHIQNVVLLTGVFAIDVALNFPEVSGVVLWAAFFASDDMVDYPNPALTLAGDIDGQTDISIIASSFQ